MRLQLWVFVAGSLYLAGSAPKSLSYKWFEYPCSQLTRPATLYRALQGLSGMHLASPLAGCANNQSALSETKGLKRGDIGLKGGEREAYAFVMIIAVPSLPGMTLPTASYP